MCTLEVSVLLTECARGSWWDASTPLLPFLHKGRSGETNDNILGGSKEAPVDTHVLFFFADVRSTMMTSECTGDVAVCCMHHGEGRNNGCRGPSNFTEEEKGDKFWYDSYESYATSMLAIYF